MEGCGWEKCIGTSTKAHNLSYHIATVLCYFTMLISEQCFITPVQRSYNVSLPHNSIPDALCELAKRLAAPAMLSGEEFQPEAAIVNYFGLGTLR